MPKGSVFPKVAVKKPSRSNVNLSTTRRFSCNVGTLIPALTLPVQSGDKVHMSISTLVKTLPFVGPLMGSFKVQMDTFYFPYRYYNSWLHDDRTDFDPYDIKFPLAWYGLLGFAPADASSSSGSDFNVSYPYYNTIAPGSLWNFLGVGYDEAPFDHRQLQDTATNITTTFQGIQAHGFSAQRYINAVPLLGYWDIFRSYYANTQEPNFPYISFSGTMGSATSQLSNKVDYSLASSPLSVIDDARQTILQTPGNEHVIIPLINDTTGFPTTAQYTGLFPNTAESGLNCYSTLLSYCAQGGMALKTYKSDRFTTWLNAETYYQNMASSSMLVSNVPSNVAASTISEQTYGVGPNALAGSTRTSLSDVYVSWQSNSFGTTDPDNGTTNTGVQNVLGGTYNTYQNWEGYGLSRAAVDGLDSRLLEDAQYTQAFGGTVYGAQHPREWNQLNYKGFIPQGTDMAAQISTDNVANPYNDWSSRQNVAIGRLSMDALYFASHLDRMLKRTQLAGGRYSDWNYVQYGNSIRAIVEAPTFIRSHSFTLSCEDVVQTSETSADNPLGTLAGRGRSGATGRHVNFYVPEHGFMMTIFSISPYVDYSQGMSWYLRMTSLGDIHVPVLDGIGFQDLISDDLTTAYTVTPQTTVGNIDNDYHYGYYGIGKQPAFIEWMTNENRVYGDFADPDRLMYMTLCRRFADWSVDLGNWIGSSNATPAYSAEVNFSSYIDPRDWNYCFADTSLESQNFWVQLAFHITAKRVISKKIMPHL